MTSGFAAEIDIQVESSAADIPGTKDIVHWLELALRSAGVQHAVCVSVSIVDQAESRRLNLEFRKRDRPTNVLSFPAGDIDGLPADLARPLGDIVLCAPVIASEAQQQGKRAAEHWAHMLVHGVLHLLGYDHIEAAAAEGMERLETTILAAGGVADPYTARG